MLKFLRPPPMNSKTKSQLAATCPCWTRSRVLWPIAQAAAQPSRTTVESEVPRTGTAVPEVREANSTASIATAQSTKSACQGLSNAEADHRVCHTPVIPMNLDGQASVEEGLHCPFFPPFFPLCLQMRTMNARDPHGAWNPNSEARPAFVATWGDPQARPCRFRMFLSKARVPGRPPKIRPNTPQLRRRLGGSEDPPKTSRRPRRCLPAAPRASAGRAGRPSAT